MKKKILHSVLGVAVASAMVMPAVSALNACASTKLLINEVNSSPDDWVELINTGTDELDISGYEIRDNSDEYLPDDVSIMIAVNKQIHDKSLFVDLGMFTNFNLFFPDGGSVPTEIITLLDPTIEYITVEKIWLLMKSKIILTENLLHHCLDCS